MTNDTLHKLRIQAEERLAKRERQIESLDRHLFENLILCFIFHIH